MCMLLPQNAQDSRSPPAIKPTKLFPTRNKVDSINTSEMDKLGGDEKEFKMKYHGDLEMTAKERLQRTQVTPEQIKLELQYLKSNFTTNNSTLVTN